MLTKDRRKMLLLEFDVRQWRRSSTDQRCTHMRVSQRSFDAIMPQKFLNNSKVRTHF